MKAIWIMMVIVVLGSSVAFADSLAGQGTAAGNAVLWFSGTKATGTFDGTFALTGQLMIADESIPFTASGWARGAGSGDTAILDIDAWATFAASGFTEDGREIAVQGGLTLSGLTTGSSDSSGSGTGDFMATIFFDGQHYTAKGTATGSARGDFVIPADPLSMELAGKGTFDLSGELTLDSQEDGVPAGSTNDSMEVLPWTSESWPAELFAELLDILSRVVDTSAPHENVLQGD